MTDRVDCLVFEDQLEALVEGRLPAEGLRRLRAHAEACAACGTQLQVKAHLASPTLAELEPRVPDDLVDGMYGRVREALDGAQDTTAPRLRRAARTNPLVPLLAAASVALLISTGLLGRQLLREQERAGFLEMELEVQQARVSGLLSAAGSAGSRSGLAFTLFRPLARRETVTVAELRELLDGLPAHRTILSAERVQSLRSLPSTRRGWVMDELLSAIPPDEGVSAGDLADLLDRASMSPDRTLRTADLLELLT